MLTSRSSPAARARLVQAGATISTPGVAGGSTSVPSMTSRPPGATSGAVALERRTRQGDDRTSTRSTTGDPIGRSATMTVQAAAPPRISGPYDGIHSTSRSAAIAARARTVPANSSPWPPKPDTMTAVSIRRVPPRAPGRPGPRADTSRRRPTGARSIRPASCSSRPDSSTGPRRCRTTAAGGLDLARAPEHRLGLADRRRAWPASRARRSRLPGRIASISVIGIG